MSLKVLWRRDRTALVRTDEEGRNKAAEEDVEKETEINSYFTTMRTEELNPSVNYETNYQITAIEA